MSDYNNSKPKIIIIGLHHTFIDLRLLSSLKKYFNSSIFLIEYNSKNYKIEKKRLMKTHTFKIINFLEANGQKTILIDEFANQAHKNYVRKTNLLKLFALFILSPILKNKRQLIKKTFPSFYNNIFLKREERMISVIKKHLNLNHKQLIIMVGKGHIEGLKKIK